MHVCAHACVFVCVCDWGGVCAFRGGTGLGKGLDRPLLHKVVHACMPVYLTSKICSAGFFPHTKIPNFVFPEFHLMTARIACRTFDGTVVLFGRDRSRKMYCDCLCERRDKKKSHP